MIPFLFNLSYQLNLVCDQAILGSTLLSVHFGGCLLGSYITGQMSDIFGRRLTVLGSLVGIVLTGTGFSFAQNYGLMCFLKFLNGCCIPVSGKPILPQPLTSTIEVELGFWGFCLCFFRCVAVEP